jgi:hypothetical protein
MLLALFGGVEVVKNVCDPAPTRVVALPANPVAGGRVQLLGRALRSGSGSIGIRDASTQQKMQDLGFGTFSWTSPLSAGSHTYHITFDDGFGSHSETSVTVIAVPPKPRRRAASQ